MSKLSWWLMGTGAFVLLLYLAALILMESASIPPSSGNPFGTLEYMFLARADDLFELIWPHHRRSRPNPVLQASHALGLAMYAYANDNGGKYPTGKSSTEVFQQLIDAEYVSNPAIFYVEELRIPGKRAATSKKLKPENVCWDVTIPAELTSDGALPLILSTGFKVNYVAGGSAAPSPGTSPATHAGIYVYYVNNSAMFRVNDGKPDDIVPDVVAPTFKASGKTYVQLSPYGPVP